MLLDDAQVDVAIPAELVGDIHLPALAGDHEVLLVVGGGCQQGGLHALLEPLGRLAFVAAYLFGGFRFMGDALVFAIAEGDDADHVLPDFKVGVGSDHCAAVSAANPPGVQTHGLRHDGEFRSEEAGLFPAARLLRHDQCQIVADVLRAGEPLYAVEHVADVEEELEVQVVFLIQVIDVAAQEVACFHGNGLALVATDGMALSHDFHGIHMLDLLAAVSCARIGIRTIVDQWGSVMLLGAKPLFRSLTFSSN